MTTEVHAAAVARFIKNAPDQTLVIGPVTERVDLGLHFIVAGANEEGFWCEAVRVETAADQAALLLELLHVSQGFIIEVYADELLAAECCQRFWPSARTRAIAIGIRTERSATRH